MKKLIDICDIQYGYAFDSAYFTENSCYPPLARIRDVKRGYSETYYSGGYPEEYILASGDLLVGMDGEFNIARWKCDGALLNQRVCKLIAKKGTNEEYLRFAMMKVLKEIERRTAFVTVKHLSAKELNKLQLVVPDLSTQNKIAEILSRLEKIIGLRRQELKRLDDLIKARFVEMFGDPYVNPLKWKKLKIKDAVTIEPQNGLYKPQSDYVTDGTGIPILRIDGFYDGMVTDFASLKRLKCSETERQRYLLLEDDIVINRVNSIEYLGKCAHIKEILEDTVYESNMMRMHFDPEYYNPVYICKLLCSQYIYDQIVNHAKKSVNQASINQKDVLDFNIYQPPLDLQNEFADFVNQVNKSKVINQLLQKMELYVSRYNRESEIKQKKCFTEICERNCLLRGE